VIVATHIRYTLVSYIRHDRAVLQRRPLIIEPGGLEGEGFESGLLKIGIEEGGSLIS